MVQLKICELFSKKCTFQLFLIFMNVCHFFAETWAKSTASKISLLRASTIIAKKSNRRPHMLLATLVLEISVITFRSFWRKLRLNQRDNIYFYILSKKWGFAIIGLNDCEFLMHELTFFQIISAQSGSAKSVQVLTPFVPAIWRQLFNHCECSEEGTN